MQIHDPHRLALLVILGRREGEPQPDDEADRRERREPRQRAAGKAMKRLGLASEVRLGMGFDIMPIAPRGNATAWRMVKLGSANFAGVILQGSRR